MNPKTNFLFIPMIEGRAKYLVVPMLLVTIKKYEMFLLLSWWILKLKNFSNF